MRRALAAVAALAVAGCTFGEQPVAPGTERTVVHAVLNPSAEAAFVLVERTLSGRVGVSDDAVSSPVDPITSGGGIPVSGARVEIRDEHGASVVAEEVILPPAGAGAPRGTGVYRLENLAVPPAVPTARPRNGIRIVPGGRYTLRVEGAGATEATTGRVLVPGDAATPLVPTSGTRTYMRDRDTLRLQWAPVAGARSYLVRVESPYGAFFVFSDTAAVTLTGELRNVFADRIPRVFQAGFTQFVTVAAVDTNFFDYYRSGNSPFTGSGLINRLTGGIGFVGGFVPVLSLGLFVRSGNVDPFDGRFVGPGPQGNEVLRLWIDTRSGSLAEVTGAYRLPTEVQYGVLGTLDGTRLRLRAVEATDARFVNRTIEGEVRGDTIVAQLRGALLPGDDGRRVFVRGPEPPPTP